MNTGFTLVLSLVTLCSFFPNPVRGQPAVTLHEFSSTPGQFSGPNTGGAYPFRYLLLAGDTLYGTCGYGSQAGGGNVFKISTDGTGFTVVHDFLGYKSGDGLGPSCSLVLSDNTLYGTTLNGGLTFPVVFGTAFSVNTDGSGLTILHAFDHTDGAPRGGVVLSGNTLYGTTYKSIFSVNTDGSDYALLHTATGTDGFDPQGLMLSGNVLYGTTYDGGTCSNGTVYAMTIDGSSYTLLHSFSATSGPEPMTNADGVNPSVGVISSGDTLYGTATFGGIFGAGTVFSIKTDGSGFKVLHSFDNTNNGAPFNLVLVGGTLYGAASLGFSQGGILFSMNTDGSGFTVLCSTSLGFGAGGLVVTNNTIYGTTYYGGIADAGTIFKFPLLPQLTIRASGTNAVLSWPTSTGWMTLQSNTNLASPASWSPVSQGPVVANGQNTVTYPISGTQQFFRLSQ
jgi:uncharacterized repeat protein (TIGR03803 family)